MSRTAEERGFVLKPGASHAAVDTEQRRIAVTTGAALGVGGTATVHRASLPGCGDVALKCLNPRLIDSVPFRGTRHSLERAFARETAILRDLRGVDGVPQLVCAGHLTPDGTTTSVPYHATTVVAGIPPGIGDGPRALRALAAIADGLHDRGILHGDIKPGNVVMTPTGSVTLLDFGCAIRLDDIRSQDVRLTSSVSIVVGSEFEAMLDAPLTVSQWPTVFPHLDSHALARFTDLLEGRGCG